jgi:hypothetical protein
MNNVIKSVLAYSLLLGSVTVFAEDPCSGTSNTQACAGPKGLVWKGYSTLDEDGSGDYHLSVLAMITEVYSNEPSGYRVPTIKELITIAEYDGVDLPTIDSWLSGLGAGGGYLISSTYGSTDNNGIKKIMVIDTSTKAVVELPITHSGGDYYLIGVHIVGEVINN